MDKKSHLFAVIQETVAVFMVLMFISVGKSERGPEVLLFKETYRTVWHPPLKICLLKELSVFQYFHTPQQVN